MCVAAIAEVHLVVDDFVEMQDRLLSVADGDPLLTWLATEHLVMLASAIYRRTDDGGLVARTSLGARPTSPRRPPRRQPRSTRRACPAISGSCWPAPTPCRPCIGQSRMLCVSVRPPGTGREYRFLGLLASSAYRESVFAIPVLRERATEVLGLSGLDAMSHTGRAIKNVVETLPRDLVFELDAHALAQLVIDIVGLQERRIVRVFDVAEPVGPLTTVLVYVPDVAGSTACCRTGSRASSRTTTAVRSATWKRCSGPVRSPGSR